ncbi:MAG: hypothetical protein CML56_06825 [Rhodobacteraceae bacterium]|nr:hypothetical protein [Paracoccaceae bacterium]
MSIITLSNAKLLSFCLLTFPTVALANPVLVKSAQWSKVDKVKYCNEGNCETFKSIELNADSIDVGQDISVTNLDTGSKITTFQVKSIRYGRMVKMCWLGDSKGMISDTYITVGGCKQR